MSTTPTQDSTTDAPRLYLAFELGWSQWKVGFATGLNAKPWRRTMAARDLSALQDAVSPARRHFDLPDEVPVCSCYEAGRDGFWLHRFLTEAGVQHSVVDSASIEVNRRAKRAKTDRMDVKLKLITPLRLASLLACVACIVWAVPGLAESWRVTVDPYAGVDWEADVRHHGNFHTHTTESDGSEDPGTVIDRYHGLGYDVLALTDHDRATWPWTEHGRDPGELGMVAVPGNELSRHHHTLSLFSALETGTRDHEAAMRAVEEAGGLSVLAHPGRYWRLEDGAVPVEVRDRYLRWFDTFPSLIGMEVVNQGDRYPHDRALWDAVLAEAMPDRPVWGMANDDSHAPGHVGLNTTVMLLAEHDRAAVRAALEEGAYYFTTVTSHPRDERSREGTPAIRRIARDPGAGTIAVAADVGGERLADEAFRWISVGGAVVHRGPTLDLGTADGLAAYVRLEIRGPGGTAFTQPFGLKRAGGDGE